MKKPVFENIFRSNEVNLKDGIAVCPYCNGTGLNAEFDLFNKINKVMPLIINACCLKCYGKGNTDWIEMANGRIDEDMKHLFENKRQLLAEYLSFFISYIYTGRTITRNHTTLVKYKEDIDQWEKAEDNNWPGHIKSKEKVLSWIDTLNEYGYIKDPESISTILKESYKLAPYYYQVARIKHQLLFATELNIETLISFENELKQLGYTIEDLNEIDIEDEFGANIEIDFNLTWENLLYKFNLPRIHKYSPVPDGVLTI